VYVRRTTKRNCWSRGSNVCGGASSTIAGNIILCIFCTRQFMVLLLPWYYTRIKVLGRHHRRSGRWAIKIRKKQCLSRVFSRFFHVSRHSVGVYAYIIIIIVICDDNIYYTHTQTLTLVHTRAYDWVENSRLSKFSFTIYTTATTQLPVFRLNSVLIFFA